jgi:hypothetical protein
MLRQLRGEAAAPVADTNIHPIRRRDRLDGPAPSSVRASDRVPQEVAKDKARERRIGMDVEALEPT